LLYVNRLNSLNRLNQISNRLNKFYKQKIKVIKANIIYNNTININRYKIINRYINKDWFRYNNI